MSLNIKSAETHQLVQELAALTGETQPMAVTIAALTVGLLSIGALRYWFLWVTAGDVLSAVLEALSLTVFTTMMVWLGVLVLSFTKSRQVSAAERRAQVLRRQAEKRGAQEMTLRRRLEAAKSEFLTAKDWFFDLWNRIATAEGTRVEDNPRVCVISFRVMK